MDWFSKHKNTLEMIRKFEPRFERYGVVPFKTAKPPKGSNGRSPETVCQPTVEI